jgi:hypothetical protein
MMKKLLFILWALTTISCEIEYDGETKLVLKGNVINENNEEIKNKEIKLFVTRNSSYLPFIFYYPSETNFIGKVFTDDSGNFTMVIPKPKNNFDEIIVEINDESNSLNSKRIVNIKTDNFDDFQLNLGESKLYSKSNLCHLQILPTQINPGIELLELSFLGDVANEIEFYNLPEEYSYYYETEKNVRKNQTIILNYKTKNYNTNIISMHQATILIDNSNEIEYILNY